MVISCEIQISGYIAKCLLKEDLFQKDTLSFQFECFFLCGKWLLKKRKIQITELQLITRLD